MLLSLKNFGLRLGGLQHPRVLARTKNDCGQDSIPSSREVFHPAFETVCTVFPLQPDVWALPTLQNCEFDIAEAEELLGVDARRGGHISAELAQAGGELGKAAISSNIS